jgi:hypothetical protein
MNTRTLILSIGLAVLLVVVVILSIAFVQKEKKENNPSTAILPPCIIWTYWNQDEIPQLIKKCIASWRRYHPNHEVRVLHPKNLSQYMDTSKIRVPWNDSPAREADIIRLHVLAEHGGLWSDASVLLFGPFPIANQAKDFCGYFIKHVQASDGTQYPAIEIWGFATQKAGTFITKWRDAFMTAGGASKSIDERADAIMAEGVSLGDIYGMRNYLFGNVTAQFVLQKKLPPTFHKEHMLLLDAESGPLKYVIDAQWNSKVAAHALTSSNKYRTGPIKICKSERLYIENHHKDWIETLLD